MRAKIRKTKMLTDKPFGATLMNGSDYTFWQPTVEMLAEEGVSAVIVNEVLDKAIFDFLNFTISKPLSPIGFNHRQITKKQNNWVQI